MERFRISFKDINSDNHYVLLLSIEAASLNIGSTFGNQEILFEAVHLLIRLMQLLSKANAFTNALMKQVLLIFQACNHLLQVTSSVKAHIDIRLGLATREFLFECDLQ